MFFVLCLGSLLPAQSQDDFSIGARVGILYGGPIPNQFDPDSTDGNPGIGPSLALTFKYQLSPKVRLIAEVGYALKSVEYGRLFRKDTLVPIELLPGVQDTVPSFYYADVAGSMGLHYLEIPVMVEYALSNRILVRGGINSAILLGGEDVGSAEIQIGEGGIFEDTTVVFDNINDIKRLDLGLTLGGVFQIGKGWYAEIRGYRSLRDLYKKGFLARQGLGDIKLYQTQGYLSLGYWF